MDNWLLSFAPRYFLKTSFFTPRQNEGYCYRLFIYFVFQQLFSRGIAPPSSAALVIVSDQGCFDPAISIRNNVSGQSKFTNDNFMLIEIKL